TCRDRRDCLSHCVVLLYAVERIMTRLGEGKVRIMTRLLAPESPSPNYPAAAVRGLPVKLVFISSSKPPGISRHRRPRVIDQLYDLYLTRQSVDGSVDEPWMKGSIDFIQKTLDAGRGALTVFRL